MKHEIRFSLFALTFALLSVPSWSLPLGKLTHVTSVAADLELNLASPGFQGQEGGLRRRGGRPNDAPLEQFNQTSWQNWWVLNQAYYLDLERRYLAKTKERERNPDLFAGDIAPDEGDSTSDRALLIDTQALPKIKPYLKHKNFAVRVAAAEAVGRMGNADHVSWLKPLIKDKNKRVRQAAIIGLGFLKSERANGLLKKISKRRQTLNDEKAYAAIALGLIGTFDSGEFLIKQLRSPRRVREVDAARLYALGLIRSHHARRYLDYYVANPLHDTALRAIALDALGLHRDMENYDRIVKALVDKDAWVRRSAATAIGQLDFTSRYREEWHELEIDLSDESKATEVVRAEFAAYKARLKVRLDQDEATLAKNKKELIALIKKVHSKESDIMVKNFLAIALGELGGDEAFAMLEEILDSSKLNSAKAFAALGLSISGEAQAGSVLAKRLKEKSLDPETRAAIYLGLGLCGHREARLTLKSSFDDESDTALAKYSAIALALLDEDAIEGTLSKRLVERSRPELKRAYGEALAISGDTEILKILEEALSKKTSANHQIQLFDAISAIQNVKSLEVLLATTDDEKLKDLALAAAIRAIGRVGEKGDLPILADTFRHLNYPMKLLALNQIATF